MTLTPFLIQLLKDNFLDYRLDKTKASGGFTAEQVAAKSMLESKLATRPQIDPSQLTKHNKMVVTQMKLQKDTQRYENQILAKNALLAFLEPGKPTSKAQGLKEELDWLAGYVLAVGPVGTRWIPGPLKKIEKTMGKTIEDYDYAWTSNKDLVRGTLACRTNEDLTLVAKLMNDLGKSELGIFLIKKDSQKSIRDGGSMGSGYSGWNFVVQFKEHREFGGEVQANTLDMLYGKHSKEEVQKHLNVSEGDYTGLQTRLKFPGGLGHALYDIQDTARSKATTAEGDWARTLALDYNDACRGNYRGCTLEELNERINDSATHFTSDVSKKLWSHAVDGSCWIHPIAH